MENKTSKYFKYAVGEILLVVIGILIALQINIWKTNKNNDNLIKKHMINLVDDLKNDIEQTEVRIRQVKRQINYIDTTATYVRNKSIDQISNIDAIYEFNMYYGYKPFTWYTAIIEEIKNSGNLNLIKNDSLRNKIISYYSFTKHLDEDFKSDDRKALVIEELQSKIINYNYPNREALLDSIRSYYTKPKNDWLSSNIFKNAKQLDLQLLTNNINDVHVLVNNLFRYKQQLTIRGDLEFPLLIENANEIISIINEEYIP